MSFISNEARCTSCHAGYGWKDDSFDFTDATNIDCLVCHDTTGSYHKAPTEAGLPAEDVDLKKVAEQVGHSSRATCGTCHFAGGGGDAIKHADLSSHLLEPARSYDIHMGGYDFTCTECHRTRNHRIAGRSTSVPPVEGLVACQDCHSAAPHYKNELLAHHLNKHCASLACNTCHSPLHAKHKPTLTWWDWSKAGDKNRAPREVFPGNVDYSWQKGEFEWKIFAKPEHAWFNGYMERVFVGDEVSSNTNVIMLNSPVGTIKDPRAKITPFKIMKGVQAVDAAYNYFLIPHLFPRDEDDQRAYWKGLDWQEAFSAGMDAAGLEHSGQYRWVETRMYWGVEHEVLPASMALGCVQCHSSLREGKSCNRCHRDRKDVVTESTALQLEAPLVEQEEEIASYLREISDYIDFQQLGYAGDPILYKSRFQEQPPCAAVSDALYK